MFWMSASTYLQSVIDDGVHVVHGHEPEEREVVEEKEDEQVQAMPELRDQSSHERANSRSLG